MAQTPNSPRPELHEATLGAPASPSLPSARPAESPSPAWILPSGNGPSRNVGDEPERSERIGLSGPRPTISGRFFHAQGGKAYLNGVTYGTFRPQLDGTEYPPRDVVDRDFRVMRAAGLNSIRTYTPPPEWLLELAAANGHHVLVGLPWTQHVTFLDVRRVTRQIRKQVRDAARSVAGHPALLGFAVGNEIPAPIVRWHGRGRVERFIANLHDIAKSEDPGALVTYVNYPTTEYLELPFLDFVSFNVYLETRQSLEGYLARLHNLAGDRPLVMAEIGLDSLRHGKDRQAEALRWQLEAVLGSGCAGAFVFAWTDEWHRGGLDIEDWDFGLTARDRTPKPALTTVARTFARGPVAPASSLPRISVVVCTHNGSRTIRQTLEHLAALDYPDYEVLVVDDGSTDTTLDIVREFDVRVISTENRGLSSARNTGAAAATGEIVAYIDDDAYPEAHWLHYLGKTFEETEYAAVGGPNILPPGSPMMAECVKHAPGGPTHVLLTDRVAEHLPGCNLAVRKDHLMRVGGFDPQFRAAGDDVDLCWRLQEAGWELGFHPGAVVYHHSRASVRDYWRQQRGYGKAEALLERKWPEKYNAAGHLSWGGRLYGPGFYQHLGWSPPRVYYGTWGNAPFQRLYHRGSNFMLSVVMVPEWHLATGTLALLSLLGTLWTPLLWALPALLVSLLLPLAQALRATARSSRERAADGLWNHVRFVGTTAFLHVTQPFVRLWGRFREGLTPWRRRGRGTAAFPRPGIVSIWSEAWRSPEEWLRHMEERLRARGLAPRRGDWHDRWDLEVGAGLWGGVRTVMTVEEHGEGRQFVRFRLWPFVRSRVIWATALAMLGLGVLASLDAAPGAAAGLLILAMTITFWILQSCASVNGSMLEALKSLDSGKAVPGGGSATGDRPAGGPVSGGSEAQGA